MACIAILFLVGTMWRTAVDADSVTATGYRELRGDDTLLAFQDFSFDADGWTPASVSDRLPGLGPVLGPFGVEPVQRSFPMPADATAAQVTFDLHLVGDWAEQGAFHIALGRTEVLTVSLSDSADLRDVDLHAAEMDGLSVAVQSTFVSPRRAEATLPGASDDFVTLRVHLGVEQPDETLTLRLQGDAEGEARWTLDNLTVVANSGDGVMRR
ncbi:hypothetical protein KUL25_16660 [Rhodobacteraceae bacterium N5(2021)]|uniref:Uncharacterized protein n=1 Tax=Gymnodinialimonas phycosphaerae TaxID=2841589 RepID=A0A975YF44_9RHOB|nr:hypothetical protein [Gymnodinialimonas phycosphaerae]MBY4894389.1 hypothetical protein [Gymnodinialimonas phycosphaerae]